MDPVIYRHIFSQSGDNNQGKETSPYYSTTSSPIAKYPPLSVTSASDIANFSADPFLYIILGGRGGAGGSGLLPKPLIQYHRPAINGGGGGHGTSHPNPFRYINL